MLRMLRIVLVFLAAAEHWYESREDQYLATERDALLPGEVQTAVQHISEYPKNK